MSIFLDSYNTTVCRMYNTKPVITSLMEALVSGVSGNLGVSDQGAYKPVFITGLYQEESDIPIFTHPITINNFKLRDEITNYLCVDLRIHMRNKESYDGNPHTIDAIRARAGGRTTELDFTIQRAICSLAWLNGEIDTFKYDFAFGHVVFMAWVTDVISKTLALDFKDQTTLSILSSLYYQSLFIEDSKISEENKQKMAVHTIKATKAQGEYVYQIFDKVDGFSGIDDFCDAVKVVLENVRVERFNSTLLINQIKNSWFGPNAQFVLPVALEHPPTWCAMLYSAMSERTYKNTLIYRTAERFSKRGEGNDYMKNFSALMSRYIIPKQRYSREDILGSLGTFE